MVMGKEKKTCLVNLLVLCVLHVCASVDASDMCNTFQNTWLLQRFLGDLFNLVILFWDIYFLVTSVFVKLYEYYRKEWSFLCSYHKSAKVPNKDNSYGKQVVKASLTYIQSYPLVLLIYVFIQEKLVHIYMQITAGHGVAMPPVTWKALGVCSDALEAGQPALRLDNHQRRRWYEEKGSSPCSCVH